jgi:hypothetical protein
VVRDKELKPEDGEASHTRWSGVWGHLWRGKWMGGMRFVNGRGELGWEEKSSAAKAELVLVVLRMLNS